MNSIINIGPSHSYPLVRPASPKTAIAEGIEALPRIQGDSVEFSNKIDLPLPAEVMSRVSLRLAKTNAIRAEIDAGTYETPERIRGTVERLLDIIV